MNTLDRRLVPWLLGVALATLAPHASHLPPWLTALTLLLIAGRFVHWHRGWRPPPRLLLFLLVIAGTFGILREYRTIFGQEPGVALLALFMALKLLELRAPRDAIVVVMLGYFLLLTHYFYDEDIPVGLWMLVALTYVTMALIRIQAPGEAPAITLKSAATMVAQSLPMMAVLFLLFPRINGPLWGLPQDARQASSGLSEQMSPGSISELTQSAAIAFRVQFAGTLPAKRDLYWRGPVMTEYDGRTWRVAPGVPTAASPAIERRGAPTRYALTLEAHQQRWLLALDLPVELPADASWSPTLSLLRKERLRERLRYEAASVIDFRVGLAESPAVLRQARALPSAGNPRARDLARAWSAGNAAAEVVVARALTHFRNENFVYTLRPPLLGQEPIDQFLFESRRGFCEHYASAFVFLMRAAGIPARVVAGYQGGEINPVDNFLVVRQSDAHAWAEVWTPTRGWMRVDPTAAIAPSRIEQGVGAALPVGEPLPALMRVDPGDWVRALRYRWDAVNNAWNQWVLGYNADLQRSVLSQLGFSGDWRELVSALAVLAGAVVVALAVWVLRQAPPADPMERLWQRFTARLSRLGLRREPWEGPLAFAARTADELPPLHDLVRETAESYARLRYGTARDGDMARLRRAVRKIPLRRPV